VRINPEPQGQTDNAHARGETRERGEFPAYVLRNLGGNITRARKRIAELEADA
jgi:hypothetical protein